MVAQGNTSKSVVGTASDFLREYTKTTKGTVAGDMLRCYWHPVCLSRDLRDVPYAVRMLGEDLVAYRAGDGRVGLLGIECPHRCASLEYGQITHEGLQCSYHGWTYDHRGSCLRMPLERPEAPSRASISHLWYPTQEWGGIVWCYMGTNRDNPPILPKVDLLARTDGELTLIRGMYSTKDTGAEEVRPVDVRNYNYLTYLENIVDLGHLYALHGLVPVPIPEDLRPYCDTSVETDFWRLAHHAVETSYGMKALVVHDTSDPGVKFVNTFSIALPNFYFFSGLSGRSIDCTDDRRESGGVLRIIDDEHFELIRFQLVRPGNYGGSAMRGRGTVPRKQYDHRKYSAWEGDVVLEDLVIQESQGVVPRRGNEHLASSDLGVVLMRKMWRQAMQRVESGTLPKRIATDNEGIFEVDTYKGFVPAKDVVIGPDNMPSSKDRRGLIRDAQGHLAFG